MNALTYRIPRHPRAWLSVACFVCAIPVIALFLRSYGSSGGASLEVWIPIIAAYWVTKVLATNPKEEVLAYRRLGANPARVAIELLAIGTAITALVTAVATLEYECILHIRSTHGLAREVGWGLLGTLSAGLAYTPLFLLAATFRNGAGRMFALGVDWVLGGAGVLGLLLPRGHAESLLGGASVGSMSGHASLFAVLLLAAVFAWLWLRRTAR